MRPNAWALGISTGVGGVGPPFRPLEGCSLFPTRLFD